MKSTLATTALCIGVLVTAGVSSLRAAEPRPTYLDPAQPLEARVEDLLSRLTFEEKIALLHADSKFTTAGVPRLGVPRRWLSDGPHGVREEIGPDSWAPAGNTNDFATCFPSGIALAATWNPDLAQAEGAVIGAEARARGKHIMLGPAVNIMRTPLCGRNFEYMGEDPFLTARMAVGYIRGEQSQDVASCVKHLAVNNQETNRGWIDVAVDERTLREIYLPAFRAAVQEAGVWTVMGAYNKLRGDFCCHNDYLINDVLKGEWGFQGLVMSDWDAVHDTRGAAIGGLDLEMGTENRAYADYFLAAPFAAAVRRGEIPMTVLDDKVRRNLRVMFATRILDGRAPGAINTKEHQHTARRVAEEAMVLLKNHGGALPLDLAKIKSIAVIGENATRLQCHGGQSSEVKPFYEISPLAGIIARAGRQVNVSYALGYDAPPEKEQNQPAVSAPPLSAAELAERAVAIARAADVVIFVGGLNHNRHNDSESWDRADLKLPYGQDALLERIIAANPRTIVVLVSGSPVEMGPWLAKAPAVLQAWYSGMEGGNALARVLFGDVNPSGKLPCTFPRKLADSPAHALGEFPGKDGVVRYVEGLLVGYRWFDTKAIEPLFPFGHGLSYTTFAYSGLKLVPAADGSGFVNAEFELTNTGTREGAEVPQVYVHQASPRLPRPAKELKGFKKVSLKPGEKQIVSIPLGHDAFAYYDPAQHGWVAEAGDFTISVGSSSRDLRLEKAHRLTETTVRK
ncbi:MAG TPA: glycoside hydrolase family 3 C-terminal domain-containing protein [Opitutaceae bacterium]